MFVGYADELGSICLRCWKVGNRDKWLCKARLGLGKFTLWKIKAVVMPRNAKDFPLAQMALSSVSH